MFTKEPSNKDPTVPEKFPSTIPPAFPIDVMFKVNRAFGTNVEYREFKLDGDSVIVRAFMSVIGRPELCESKIYVPTVNGVEPLPKLNCGQPPSSDNTKVEFWVPLMGDVIKTADPPLLEVPDAVVVLKL